MWVILGPQELGPVLADNIAAADEYCDNHKLLDNHHFVVLRYCSGITSPLQNKEKILLTIIHFVKISHQL